MATPYSEIYDLYFGMTSDYEFLNLSIQDQNTILEGWLLNAISEFNNCKKDLSDRNGLLEQFNQTLSDSEKTILAKYMLANWLSPKLYCVENLKNYLSSKDFSLYSPANLLKEIRNTYKEAYRDANKSKIQYGYHNFNPNDTLVRG